MAKLTRYSSFEELKSSGSTTAQKSTSANNRLSALEVLHNLLKNEPLIQRRDNLNNGSDEKQLD